MAFAPELGNPSSPPPPGSLKRTASEMKSSNIATASLMLWQHEAVDRPFRAVIEQLQPKQRPFANINLVSPKHADFAVPNRGERNRRFWTILQNSGEFDESSRNSQFGKRAFGVSQPIKPQILKCVVRTMQVRRMHNRAAANGAARLFTFDKPEAASADGYSKTGQNALVRTRPIICCFAPASRASRPATPVTQSGRRDAAGRHRTLRLGSLPGFSATPQVIALAQPAARPASDSGRVAWKLPGTVCADTPRRRAPTRPEMSRNVKASVPSG